MHFQISAFWDSDADVWVATCDGLGLATEADSLDTLESKLREFVPELVALNYRGGDEDVPFDLLVHDKHRRSVCA
jgi:predicted nucleotidyltransferase